MPSMSPWQHVRESLSARSIRKWRAGAPARAGSLRPEAKAHPAVISRTTRAPGACLRVVNGSRGLPVFPNGNTLTRKVLCPTLFQAGMPELRNDPRFVPLCARLGLVEFWLATGKWPDCVDDVPYDFKGECEKARAVPIHEFRF